MLAASLRRHVHFRTFEQLQEPLLHPFATHVASDGRVIALACDLVDLVDEDNPNLSFGQIIVCRLKQARQNAFHIFTYVSRLRQNRGINNGERHIQHFGDGARQQGFPRSCIPYENDVALVNFWSILHRHSPDALVVVVHRYAQGALGRLLPDDVFIKVGFDLRWRVIELWLARYLEWIRLGLLA